jgi:hypothetical protein
VNFSQQKMRRSKSEGGRPSSGKDISFSHQPIFRVLREERYRRPLEVLLNSFASNQIAERCNVNEQQRIIYILH